MRRVSRWGAAWVAVAVAGLFGLVVVAGPAEAALNRPFGIRYQSQDRGDILLRGNSLLTCPAAATTCLAARDRSATGDALDNNAYTMEFTDIDSDTATRSSSSARVTLPAGATVKFAGLYWSGYTGGTGTGNVARTAPPAGTAKNRLMFKTPASSAYQTITANPATPTNPVDGTSGGLPYVSFADVTGLVQAGGTGDYTGADIFAATGPDSYAAWSLVVVIRDTTLPRRDLIVFDGFGTIQANPAADNTLNIPLTNLSTPASGAVDVQLGAVVFEGDAGKINDRFQIIAPDNTATTLSDALNDSNNSFNSTNSDGGVAVTGRVPDGNQFGYDADVFESSVLLGNSATTATLRMTTTGETFFPAVATFVANSYAPQLDVVRSSTLTDTDTVADGRTRPGDRITYTIDVTNNGDASSVDTRIADTIPAGTTYVPGSLAVTLNGTAVPSNGEVNGSAVTVRPGTGASSSTGGTLVPGATTRITYTVEISAPFTAGGTVPGGAASAAYSDPGARTFSAGSNTTGSIAVVAARTDRAVTQTASPTRVQRDGSLAVSWAATVTNNGPETETAPVLTETLPSGVTGVTSPGVTCTVSGTTYSCPLPTLASGASRTVTFNAILPATASDPSSASAVASGAGTDSTPANNTASTGIVVNAAPTATPAFASVDRPEVATTIDVLAGDADPDVGDVPTILSVTQPAHGTVTIVTGKVRYDLTDASYVGPDSFTYTISDGRGGTATAAVSVAVNDPRRADLKVTQAASPTVVQRDGNLSVSWTATVTNAGPQNEPTPKLVENLPAGVTGITVVPTGVTIVGGGSCSTAGTVLSCPLSPLAGGASATVRFTATLPATAADPSTATAIISGQIPDPDPTNNSAATPVAVNRPPSAAADTATLPADVLSVDVAAAGNDADQDADPLTITAVTTPAHGTATVVDGKIRYTLTDPTFVGNETLSYTVCDGRGGCDTESVTVAVADHEVADLIVTQSAGPKLLQRNGPRVATWTVTVRNAGPESSAEPVLVQTLPDGVTAVSSTLPACTVSGPVATCPLAALASGESATIAFTATLPADGADPATARSVASGSSPDPDASNNTALASVALNTAPVADGESVALGSTSLKVTIDVLDGDRDADTDPLTLTSVGTPKHGTATIVDGKIRYQLTDLDFAGDDSFNYLVCDDRSGCDTAEVTVRVADHQHAPVAVADRATVAGGAAIRVDVVANDTDQDGGRLKLRRITRPAADGTATVVKGALVYTPDEGFVGTDTVHYEVCDPSGLCDEAVATIRVTAAAPVVKPDAATVRPGGTTVIDVLGNDVDPGGYPFGSVTIVKDPGSGTATVGKDNKIRYQASDSAKAGSKVTIGYRVCNKSGACSTGLVVLTVAGEPVKGTGLAFTGSRFLGPLGLTGMGLLLGGMMFWVLMSRGQMVPVEISRGQGSGGGVGRDVVPRGKLPRGRHKA